MNSRNAALFLGGEHGTFCQTLAQAGLINKATGLKKCLIFILKRVTFKWRASDIPRVPRGKLANIMKKRYLISRFPADSPEGFFNYESFSAGEGQRKRAVESSKILCSLQNIVDFAVKI